MLATATNLFCDRGPAEAKLRLDRLAAAGLAFPGRRISSDPFVKPTGLTIKFPSGPPLPDIQPVAGTSLHDAIVRPACRVYDQLGVVETREYTDPETGEVREGVVNQNAHEFPDGRVVIGPPTCRHYAELPWSDRLWERLREAHLEDLLSLAHSGVCDLPYRNTLLLGLDHEYSLHPSAVVLGASPALIRRQGRPPADPKRKAADIRLYRDWKASPLTKAEFLRERYQSDEDRAEGELAIGRGEKHVKAAARK